MKSKTALFNKGVSLNLLKRYWPLWLGYLIIIMMVIPGGILPRLDNSYLRTEQDIFWHFVDMNRSVLRLGNTGVTLSIFSGVIAAMVMYSFMYTTRGCTMMCALPVRRESLFVTTYLTGLIPMLLIDALAVAVTAVPAISSGYVDAINLWRLLAMLMLSNVAFYSFAVFCAVLTGNIVVLPAVYLVLNAAVVLAEQSVRSVLDIVVYGYNNIRGVLTGFSPIFAATDWFHPVAETAKVVENGHAFMQDTGKFTVDHFYVLVIYCVVGLALAALALCIYRRRDMECAGDVVAVPILKPIFKYCMCFGVAFCFAVLVYNNVFYRSSGLTEALIVLALLLVGAFIGYFVAEMLIQKTLRVFKGKWAGYIVSAAVLCAFLFAAEFDMTGYEKRLPDVSEVKDASLGYYEHAELEKSESIETLIAYHSQLLDEKAANETAQNADMITLDYTLKDGKRISRRYPIAKDDAQLADETSAINCLFPVVNMQEAIDKRAATVIPVVADSVYDGWFNGYYMDEEDTWHNIEYKLTAEQVEDFYNNCILPDAARGKLKRIFPVNTEEYYSCATTVSFSFGMRDEELMSYYYDFVMYMDAPRCTQWIAENTDIELLPVKEADPRQAENDSVYLNYYKPVYEAASSTLATIG